MFTRMQAVFVLSASLLTGLAHAEKYEQRLPVQPHGMVEISNVAGRIEVQGWDNPEVEVRGDIGEGVEKVDFATDHGHTIIKVRVPNHSFHSASADLRIRVPRDSELDISGVSSEVVVANVEGELMAKTVSGNVRADVFGRDTEIKTVSGDMTLRLSPSHSIRLRSTSGDIGLEGKLTKGGNIDAETVSGELTVRASHEGGLDYQVNTFSGDIKNCMGLDSERVSKYGPGRRLNGTRGEGADQARIRLKTMSGDVELCDKT